MKKILLKLFICYVLLFYLYDLLFRRYLPESHAWYKVAMASAAMLIPTYIFIGLFYRFKNLSLLMNADKSKPRNGKRIAVTGTIRPLRETLTAPISGKTCVAYTYGIGSWQRSGKNRTFNYHYGGNAQTPLSIRTKRGDIKILAFLERSEKQTFGPEDPEYENVIAFIRTTKFEDLGQTNMVDRLRRVKDLITDSDGEVQIHWKLVDGPQDLFGLKAEETIVQPDTEYSIIGVWSDPKQGILTDPFGKGAIEIFDGTARDAVKSTVRIIIFTIFMALFLTVFINFFIYGFFQK